MSAFQQSTNTLVLQDTTKGGEALLKDALPSPRDERTPHAISDEPPDGGLRAWIVVFGVSLSIFIALAPIIVNDCIDNVLCFLDVRDLSISPISECYI